MTTHAQTQTSSLTQLIAQLALFPESCDPDFDNETEELERQFAELRLTFMEA